MRPARPRPARTVTVAFLGAIAVGTALLLLPVSRAGPESPSLLTALFTATSAVTTSGMTIADTATYWSGFGHVLLTVLTQAGGFGITTIATLAGLLVSQRLGLRGRMMAGVETNTGVAHGDVRQVLVLAAVVMLAGETVIATIFAARLHLAYDVPWGQAAWEGVFNAVQAFNNCGFSLRSDGLTGFAGDWWICVPLTLGVIVGGIGVPVLHEIGRQTRRPAAWSTHTRLTVGGTLVLLVAGFAAVLALEWGNAATLGPLGVPGKILAAFVQGTIPRSGGFNTVDYGAMNEDTSAVVVALMFIGGGSASTAGGIKVTTFLLLAYVIWAEVRGERDVVIGRRRIAEATQRQAGTVAFLGAATVATGTLVLLVMTDGVPFDRALFEIMSAFSTAGLTTGLTGELSAAGQLVLSAMMFIGRVGTVAVASALALNTRQRRYRYPEERPIVG
ncbi:TrkH family potassium uptake protein [Paractinoplanes brasiliensis]|uniref:Trk-type K+ transport system membrane component n=1 Tax=Paractinoplanes brasiliensis TaxID=52695 RepID=A0A4V3C6A5_9ACTN|nr:potassium transporter TrkG [Actinoplanes brasiliensis]TDO32978.1 Trk-type K+ transport system membrane component [Actinoplanes brasiliensis]GID28697.1 potassium transporter Trk [Actinoplanes brasiliensis]